MDAATASDWFAALGGSRASVGFAAGPSAAWMGGLEMAELDGMSASELFGQAILVLRRKAEAMPTEPPLSIGVRGTLEYCADKLAEMLPMIELVERMAEGKNVRD